MLHGALLRVLFPNIPLYLCISCQVCSVSDYTNMFTETLFVFTYKNPVNEKVAIKVPKCPMGVGDVLLPWGPAWWHSNGWGRIVIFKKLLFNTTSEEPMEVLSHFSRNHQGKPSIMSVLSASRHFWKLCGNSYRSMLLFLVFPEMMSQSCCQPHPQCPHNPPSPVGC